MKSYNINLFDVNSRESGFSLMWLKFWVYCRIPFSILKLASDTFNAISENPLIIIYVFSLTIFIIATCFLLLTMKETKKLTPLGYKLNIILISIEALLFGVNAMTGSNGSIGNIILYFFIGSILGGIFWFFPNYIYFRKRRLLFGISPKKKALQSNSIGNKSQIKKCVHCMNPIKISDMVICANCKSALHANCLPNPAFCIMCGNQKFLKPKMENQ